MNVAARKSKTKKTRSTKKKSSKKTASTRKQSTRKRQRTPAQKAAQTRKARQKAEQKRALEREKKKAKFLEGLELFGTIRKARIHAAIESRSTIYRWRDEDEAFAQAWDYAKEEFDDVLEEEAFRRGKDGVEKPVYQSGRLVGYVQEYSDGLLKMVMQARIERYHPKTKLDVSSAGGVVLLPSDATPDQWDELVKNNGEMQGE